MNKIAVMVATGFEDTELVGTVDRFSRENIQYDLISIENKTKVTGQENIAIVNTIKFDDVNLDDYKAIFLPGGSGHKLLLKSLKLKEAIVKFNSDRKLIFAICAAPEVLKEAGILNKVTITSYPGFAVMDSNTGNEVEVFGNIVTGKNMEATIVFAEAAAKEFLKKQ